MYKYNKIIDYLHRAQERGQSSREWAMSEGTKRKILKAGISLVKLSETLQS